MQSFTRCIALMASVLLVGAVSAAPAAAKRPATVPGLPVYLSLGDSWAFGFGATTPREGGYVPQLHEELREGYDCLPAGAAQARNFCKQLQLVNLAVGGATTPALIANQLPVAKKMLKSRNGDRNPRNDVEVITLHIGGNDVVNPILGACLGGLTSGCLAVIQAEFSAYRSDLDTALSRLRGKAGDEAVIVIGTYDNGVANCNLGAIPGAVQLADIVLEGFPPLALQGLHDIMRDVGEDHGVEVAEVYGDFAPQDWVGGNDCLHPVDSGYDKVTDAFEEVLLGP